MYIICWWWSSKLTLIINAIGNTPWLEHTQRSYSIFRDYHLYIQNDNDLNMILHKIISIIKFIIPCVQRMWLLINTIKYFQKMTIVDKDLITKSSPRNFNYVLAKGLCWFWIICLCLNITSIVALLFYRGLVINENSLNSWITQLNTIEIIDA